MKILLAASVLLILMAGNARSGSEYDRCIKEEKVLKTEEASQCSGLRYLFNPSACFATQKSLKEYAAGKCRNIGMAEKVDFSVQAVIPEKKDISAASPGQKKAETDVPLQQDTIEQLKEENARLKAEINRLKAENEQLRKAGR